MATRCTLFCTTSIQRSLTATLNILPVHLCAAVSFNPSHRQGIIYNARHYMTRLPICRLIYRRSAQRQSANAYARLYMRTAARSLIPLAEFRCALGLRPSMCIQAVQLHNMFRGRRGQTLDAF